MARHSKTILIAVVALTAFLRLAGLGTGELIFDEGLYAFRSIGYLDYLDSVSQTTPIQWLAPQSPDGTGPADTKLPWWLKLSFHDHPPLVFLVQHIFFRLFGDSLFVARLPSALGGVVSVFLFYLIGNLIGRQFLPQSKNKSIGLTAALIASVGFALVSNSHLAMMEGILFPLILLNIYYFLRLCEDTRHWWKFGLTLGLCFLTKYVSLFLIPTYALYLLISKAKSSMSMRSHAHATFGQTEKSPGKSHLLKDKRLYFSMIAALAVFLPVVVYNIYSYQTFGHFDLQLGYILGQKLPWDTSFGGKTQEPFSNIAENLTAVFSIPFLILATLGLALILIRHNIRKELIWLPLMILFITLMLIKIGSAVRFVSLFAIPGVLLAAMGLGSMRERYNNKRWALIPIAAFFIYELTFTANLTFFNPPDYGVVKLDRYLDEVFDGQRGPGLPSHSNTHLNRVIQSYGARPVRNSISNGASQPAPLEAQLLTGPATLTSTGIIYDDNLSLPATLWLFSRRQYYHGIPIMPASAFHQKIKSGETEMFKDLTLYFVKAEAASPLKPIGLVSNAGDVEQFLQKNGRTPDAVIKAAGNTTAFRVYKFSVL